MHVPLVLALLAASADPVTLTVPLRDGVLDVGELLSTLAGDNQDARAVFDELSWRIEVDGEARRRLEALDRLAGDALSVRLTPEALTLELAPETLSELQRRLERSAEGWLGDLQRFWTGGEQVFGVTLALGDDGPAARTRLDDAASPPARLVLLVHGLDDPGWIWSDLIPALRGAGHHVARFEYPDDGPIADSADRLAAALADLRSRGVRHVDIVAHSMGGLVARDVLTRSTYYGGQGAGGPGGAGGRYPSVDRLVMLGTPNAGAPLARLHKVAEWRQQIVQAIRGRDPWVGPVNDGRGEAAEDLLPGSVYLKRLNERPLPDHTRITIVAGRLVPDDLARGPLGDIAASLGDGVVTLESARLEGVEDTVVVNANHMTMIHTIVSSDRVPPGVDVVLDRLGR